MVSEIFANDIVEAVKLKMPDYEYKVQTIVKNNDVKLTGLAIIKDTNISPIFYLDAFSGKPIQDIADEIIDIYNKNNDSTFDVSDFLDILSNETKLSNCVLPKLVSSEQDLSEYIYSDFVDGLKVLYYIPIYTNIEGRCTITLTKNHLSLMPDNINADILFKMAKLNIKECTVVLNMPKNLQIKDNPNFMEIMTTKFGTFGAASIIDNTALDNVADVLGDFYIIPSSIHEVLIIPIFSSVKDLVMMIQTVNRTALSQTEVLSNNLYRYNKNNHIITKEEV